MSKFLSGKKTYLGLAVALIGVFGLAKYISPDEATAIINGVFEIVGIVFAIYGRYVARP